MSRDEAASVYLEVLLGFRAEYRKFSKAVEILTDREKILLDNAVLHRPAENTQDREKQFFWIFN